MGARLRPYLEPVNLLVGEILCRADEPLRHVFFPNRGTVSVVSVFADGGSVQVGMVGNESGIITTLLRESIGSGFNLKW